MDLTSIDYKILAFINQFEKVEKSKVVNRFSSRVAAIEYRMKLLSEREYRTIPHLRIAIENTSYIIEEYESFVNDEGITSYRETGFISITEKGKSTLQNHLLEKKSVRRRKYEEWFWRVIPILISLFALARTYHWL